MTRALTTTMLMLATAALLSPGALADNDDTRSTIDDITAPALAADADCGPPCGYIYPILTIHADIKTPIQAADIPDLPAEVPIDVTFWWDFEQDGTGLPDKTDMAVTLVITKKPEWLSATLQEPICSFTLNPAQNEYPNICGETKLLLDLTETPTTVADIEDRGPRLMLFATSEESGTFKKSYGVKDIRFKADDTLLASDAELTEESRGLGIFVPVMVGLLAATLIARRRL